MSWRILWDENRVDADMGTLGLWNIKQTCNLKKLQALLRLQWIKGDVVKVCELMNPRVVAVGPKTPLYEALELMLRFHLNDVLIVDTEQRLAGIVTYPDISRKLLPSAGELMEHEEYLMSPETMEDRFRDIARIPIDQIMTRNVITVSPDLEALKAGAIMTAKRVKQLPVVRDHRVIGIISYTDIGWGLMRQYAECIKG
jgi:CBS domain-containing protein